MKQQQLLINKWLKRQVLMIFALLAMPLGLWAANPQTYTKVYDFTSFQSHYEAQARSGYIILNGEDHMWEFRGDIEPVNSNGLMLRGVSSEEFRIQSQESFPKITNVTVYASASSGSNGTETWVYLSACNSSSVFMEVTGSYQDYSFDIDDDDNRVRIYLSTYWNMTADVCIKKITVTYTDGEEEPEPENVYDLWIDDTQVNSDNMADVKGDGTISFDGNKRLILNNAKMSVISSFLPDGLELFLQGQNEITNEYGYAIFAEGHKDNWEGDENGNMGRAPLTFLTNCNDPGTFVYNDLSKSLETVDRVFEGSELILRDNLTATLDLQSHSQLTIAVPLQPIVDDVPTTSTGTETYIDYSTNAGAVETSDLSNFTYRNVLYTLHDTQKPNVADDGFANGQVVLNSTMTDAEVATLNTKVNGHDLVPGTTEYATAFKGLTFVVPAGTGIIKVNAETAEGYEFHLKIGGQLPVPVVDKASNGGADYEIPYAVSTATYVYLYLTTASTASVSQKRGGRIGPKSTVSGGLGGLGVSGNSIADTGNASGNYLMCTADMFQFSANGGITVDNVDVTDIDATAFSTLASAPHRALGDADIPFIDLTKTSIIGKDISRQEGAFAGFSKETLIYMPAGNSSSEPNVIIAGVCENLQLTGNTTKTFALPDALSSFVAAQASYQTGLLGLTSAVFCLPYASKNVQEEAIAFDYDGFDASTGTVKLKAVDTAVLEANKAYAFSSESAVGSLPIATTVTVEKPAKASNPSSASEADGLHGVYKYYSWSAGNGPSGVYALQRDGDKAVFQPIGGSNRLYAFGGYLRLSSAPTSVEIDWGGGTSVIPLTADQVRQDADGWYTITGFRLPGKPTGKGLFIHNGKKVVR